MDDNDRSTGGGGHGSGHVKGSIITQSCQYRNWKVCDDDLIFVYLADHLTAGTFMLFIYVELLSRTV